MKIHCPIYYQIYEREGTRWFFHAGKVFYNAHDIPTDLESTLERNGLTKINVLVELFRINGGKSGYYLALLAGQRISLLWSRLGKCQSQAKRIRYWSGFAKLLLNEKFLYGRSQRKNRRYRQSFLA
jgi:hypothetical protein